MVTEDQIRRFGEIYKQTDTQQRAILEMLGGETVKLQMPLITDGLSFGEAMKGKSLEFSEGVIKAILGNK